MWRASSPARRPAAKHTVQPHGGANDPRVLAVVRDELQPQRQAVETGIGIEIAGVPSAVHGAFMRESRSKRGRAAPDPAPPAPDDRRRLVDLGDPALHSATCRLASS